MYFNKCVNLGSKVLTGSQELSLASKFLLFHTKQFLMDFLLSVSFIYGPSYFFV